MVEIRGEHAEFAPLGRPHRAAQLVPPGKHIDDPAPSPERLEADLVPDDESSGAGASSRSEQPPTGGAAQQSGPVRPGDPDQDVAARHPDHGRPRRRRLAGVRRSRHRGILPGGRACSWGPGEAAPERAVAAARVPRPSAKFPFDVRQTGKRRRLARGAALAAAGLLVVGPLLRAPSANASAVVLVPLGEMAQRADQIVTGRVVGVASQFGIRGASIHTFVTIEVDSWLKGGRGGSLITLRVLGGEAGGYRLLIAGAPRFELDEEVLVFTDGGAGRIPTVFGLAQGKFRIETDASSGRRVLSRSLVGLNLTDGAGGPSPPPALVERAPLVEVEAAISAALRQ